MRVSSPCHLPPFADFLAFFAAFTHLPCFLTNPALHLFGLDFGFATDLAAGSDGGKFPTPANVSLDGVAKIGGAAGTPWQPVPVHRGGTTPAKPPSTRAS